MAEEYSRLTVRCTISGHLFDLNEDLGAVATGHGAVCSPCMDKLFNVTNTLHPNGERPSATPKARKAHTPFRHKQKR